jgi:hypothetical protein
MGSKLAPSLAVIRKPRRPGFSPATYSSQTDHGAEDVLKFLVNFFAHVEKRAGVDLASSPRSGIFYIFTV